MPKIRSLKINEHFRKVLRANRVHNNYFSIFFTKNFLTTDKSENILFISFITKKKIGNAVKRNRIKRKLKMAANKILKKHKIFDSNKVYLISANDKAYKAPFAEIYMQMKKSLGNI